MLKFLYRWKKLFILLLSIGLFVICSNTIVYADRSNGMGDKVITGGQRDFKWPVPSSNTISSCFLDLIGHNESSHSAIDIVASHYSPVIAAYPGTVVAVTNSCTDDYPIGQGKDSGSGFGNYVVLQHNYTLLDGSTITLYSRYSHLSSVSVTKGSTVAAGTQVGKVGSTGFSYGYHLDFQICYGGWSPYQTYSRDPYVNNLLELPSGLNANGADTWCTCCYNYVDEVKKLYSTPTDSFHNPEGSFEFASGGYGMIRVKGYAFDRDDLSKSIKVHVYIDGTYAGEWTAENLRTDLSDVGTNHGFDFPVFTEHTGEHTVTLYAINEGEGTANTCLGSKTITLQTGFSPQGVIGNITGGEGNIKIEGWAFDRDDLTAPLEIHVYADGFGVDHFLGSCIADYYRPDLPIGFANAGVEGLSDYHGYNTFIESPLVGTHEIFITAINIGTGENISLGSKTVNISAINHNPRGVIGDIIGGEGNIKIEGWAFDRDALDTPLEIHVYADGYGIEHFVGSCIADHQRSDLPEGFSQIGLEGLGEYHGYNKFIQTSLEGIHEIFITAINIGTGENISLGSKTVNISPINHNPRGEIDAIVGGEGNIKIEGWAFDYDDLEAPLEIHIYADGYGIEHFVGSCVADCQRSDLPERFAKIGIEGVGEYHGYNTFLQTTLEGVHEIFITAINVGTGENISLGSQTVNILPRKTEQTEHVHSYVSLITKAATCTKTGIILYTCINGDDSYEETIPATGHIWEKEYTVDVEPTYNAAGSKSIHCSRCDIIKTGSKVTISKLEEQDSNNPFTDVKEGVWYYNSVMYAYENGLLTGTSATTFEPNSPMTRGMLVTVLYRLEGRPAVSVNTKFPDVSSGKYYANPISWASEENIVSGYSNGNFGPNDSITREQIAKVLYRYAEYKEYDVTASQSLDGFSDASSVSSYAKKYMQWATAEGLIKGSNGVLNPKGDATRAEISAILKRFIEKYE